MKIDFILGVLFLTTLLGCELGSKSNKDKISGHSSECENYYLESNRIDSIARYLFSIDMKSIENDSCINRHYNCKKGTEEEEGTVWLSLSFFKDKSLKFIAETDWIDTNRISRITFLSNDFKLKNGLAAGATFNVVKNEIDTLNRRNYPDGSLEFYLKGDTSTVFVFDVMETKKLFYGYEAIKEIPDTLKVASVVVFRGEND